MKGLDEEISFAQAARVLKRKRDPEGRKLRRLVLARERQTKKPIAIRLEGQMRVTMGALYRAFPEMQQSASDQLAQMVRPMVEHAEARTRAIVQEELAISVFTRLDAIEEYQTITKRYLSDLAKLEASKPTKSVHR